jgi:DNA polymerase III subunit beta
MKQTVLQENLNQALAHVQKAIPSRPTLPVLSSVLMDVTKKGCTISATDLYFGVRAHLVSTSEQDGSVVIPGKQFKEIVQSLPPGKVALELDSNQVRITAEKTKAAVPCQDSSEYPPFPQPEGKQYRLSREQLDAIKSLVIKSASPDPTRPVLTGVCLQFSGGQVTVAGTDSFRLSVLQLPLQGEEAAEDGVFIIPAKVLEEVQRIAEQQQAVEAVFTVSEELKQVFFSFEDVEVFARLIEGEYPPYEKIIPTQFETEIEVGCDELQDQLKRAMIFSKDASNIVQMEYTEQALVIKASSPVTGAFEGEVEAAKITGEAGGVAFNARYILEFLQATKQQAITIKLNGSQKPALLQAPQFPAYQYIVMPFRINQ